MALLSMRGVSLSFGLDPLLDNVDFHIEQGDRACLVGRNGVGKSSLLKLLHGDIEPDRGEIIGREHVRVAYLPQEIPTGMSGRVSEMAVAGLRGIAGRTDTDETAYRVEKILSQLKLDPQADFAVLSGGNKRKALIAGALACDPDVLLLDEPTNHLDIDTITWLEGFLTGHGKTILFVTHDRAFLRKLANRIIDLDRGRMADWACDYDTFLMRKQGLIHEENISRAAFEKKLEEEETWIRRGIKARRTRNEGRVKALLKMRADRRAWRESPGVARVRIHEAERSGRIVVKAEDVGFSYPGNTVIDGFSATITRGDRVGIVGPNGCGKTTLLNLLLGQLKPESGSIKLGTRLETSFFDQLRDALDENSKVMECVGNGHEFLQIGGKQRHVMGYLRDFLFSEQRARTPVRVLSGGERNRVLMARLFAEPSNLLILDEPTNDLDAETLELFEEQLADYTGTVLLVTHDREFLNNVVTSVLVFEGEGKVVEYVGGYDDWVRAVETRRNAESMSRKARVKRAVAPGGKRKLSFKEKKELDSLPELIAAMEKEQLEIHDRMAVSGYFQNSRETILQDKNRLQELVEAQEAAYARWEELDELA